MKDKKLYIILCIIILAILLSPVLFKSGIQEKVFTSEETYKNLIQTKQINPEQNTLQQLIQNNPYHVILKKIPLNDVNLAIIIPLITGIITLITLFFILRKLNISDNETILIIMLLVLTPVFLYKFTTLNPDNIAFPLLLLTTLLYLHKSYTSIIPLLLTTLINPVTGIVFLIFIIIQTLIKKERKKITTSLIITTIITLTYTIIQQPFQIITTQANLDKILIELGSTTGYSIPIIILGVIGIFAWWEKKEERITTIITLIAGFTASIFIPQTRLAVALVLAIFAGIGLNQLIHKEWELKKIKQISTLLIFYIILFSAILTINTQLTQTTQKEVEAAKFLEGIPTQGKTLSIPEKGYMIEYISNKPTILNKDTTPKKIEELNEIFYARKLSELETKLQNNNITFIYINQEMKQGKTWTGREEGLLFFLIHSEQFIKIFDNEEVQIHQYIKKIVE